MARSSPAIRLSSRDFPTFATPAIATVAPSRRNPPGFRRPGPRRARRPDDRLDHDGIPVEMDLRDILAGETVRSGEEDGQRGVEDLAARVAHGTPAQGPRGGVGRGEAGEPDGDGKRIRTGKAHDGDGPGPARRGGCDDRRVFAKHLLILLRGAGGVAAGGGRSEVKRSRAGSPHGEPRTESPSQAAQPECCHISLLHYAVTAFAASALRLYIICCPMLRILFTSQ